MSPEELTRRLKQAARAEGFDPVGAAPLDDPPGLGELDRWLADGFAGQMSYIERRLAVYRDPGLLLPGARSALLLGLGYRTVEPAAIAPGYGRVSRYAWNADYHELIRPRLRRLVRLHGQWAPGGRARGFVDTAPVLERALAHWAGLGWFGKNTMLIHARWGSWFFLAGLFSTEQLVYDAPAAPSRCGSCRRCLEACPTGALVEPYRLDARKCISYLTIERRGALSRSERAALGDCLFGCDACQEVCPWNQRTDRSAEPGFHPLDGMNPAPLEPLAAMDEATFRQRFRRSPFWRAGHKGLRRNALAVLENQSTRADVDSSPPPDGEPGKTARQTADDAARDAGRAAIDAEVDRPGAAGNGTDGAGAEAVG